MLKAMRMASLRCKMSVIIIELIIAIIIMNVYAGQVVARMGDPVDLLTVSANELDGIEYGSIDLSQVYVLGCYSSLYGSYEGDAYYYLVYVGNMNTGLGKYMGIKVKRSHKQVMENLTEQSWAILAGETVEDTENDGIVITGRVTSMESTAYSHFKSGLKDIGFSDVQIQESTLNLMLVEDETGLKSYVMFGIGEVLFLTSTLQFLYILTGIGQNRLKKELKKKGTGSFALAEQEFIEAENFGPYIRIGQRYTFLVTGAKNHILQNDEIIWVHIRVDIKKKQKTKKWVLFYTKERKIFKTRVPGEEEAAGVLDKYHSISKRIVLGFNLDLKQLYENDFDRFLNLAYNSQDSGSYTEEE